MRALEHENGGVHGVGSSFEGAETGGRMVDREASASSEKTLPPLTSPNANANNNNNNTGAAMANGFVGYYGNMGNGFGTLKSTAPRPGSAAHLRESMGRRPSSGGGGGGSRGGAGFGAAPGTPLDEAELETYADHIDPADAIITVMQLQVCV